MTVELAIQVILEALLGFLTAKVVQFINSRTKSELAEKYTSMVMETVTRCVLATNQTFVDSLKKSGAFTPEAQKEAFQQTYDMVMTILSDEVKTYMTSITGDFDLYLHQLIESQVKLEKD